MPVLRQLGRANIATPRQVFFEEKLREIAWILGGSKIPVHLDFEGEQRQLDKGCIGHAIANGVLREPGQSAGTEIEFVELAEKGANRAASAPELWKEYARNEIPPLFDLEFNSGSWQQGFLVQGKEVFLLVTLDKSEHLESYQYEDGFHSPISFHWQSQNRTSQSARHGQIICGNESGYTLHLFVRATRLVDGKAAPFTYFGPLKFNRWDGERPISVEFDLEHRVPSYLWESFGVPNQTEAAS